MRTSSTAILLSVVFASLSAGEACAQSGLVDELRVGLYDHDTQVIGFKREQGLDVAVDLVSAPINQLSLIGSPRFLVGVALNSAGQTNQVYAGLTAAKNFSSDVFKPGDAFFIEGTVGGALHDGKINVAGTPEERQWKSHGSRLLFRIGYDVGYRFDSRWALALSFNHISNARLAHPNQGANNLGLRLQRKF